MKNKIFALSVSILMVFDAIIPLNSIAYGEKYSELKQKFNCRHKTNPIEVL